MKVALSHDWLNGMRGGEKCLELLCELYPGSTVYTLFYEKGKISEAIARHPIVTSRIQRFPKVFTHYRYYLPFFPSAVEAFDLRGYPLVISTSHCAAKGIRKDRGALHICYCFTPMRYAWGFFEDYFGKKSVFSQTLIRYFLKRLREWDHRTSRDVDQFVAISNHVKKRIREFYDRDSEVVYPPVDTDFFCPDPNIPRENFYLIVSALVPYKKVDLAVRLFNRLNRPLVVIGEGPERASLEKSAKPNACFLGWQSDAVIRDYYRKARALIFPGEEDFGIVPVEAQACGTPVIALGKGGVLETITAGKTGIFFDALSEESLESALILFEKTNWNPGLIRENSLRFGKAKFKSEMEMLAKRLAAKRNLLP